MYSQNDERSNVQKKIRSILMDIFFKLLEPGTHDNKSNRPGMLVISTVKSIGLNPGQFNPKMETSPCHLKHKKKRSNLDTYESLFIDGFGKVMTWVVMKYQ